MTEDREPTGSWDWDRPFDDDFMSGAAPREPSGAERAERAARIAGGHERATPWRGDPRPVGLRPPKPLSRRRRWQRRDHRGGFALVAALLVVLTLVVVNSLRDGDAPPSVVPPLPAVTPGAVPVVPTDALTSRLLPLPAAVPGSGGYRFLDLGGPLGEVRWDPCRPVHFAVRDEGAPPGGAEAVRQAFLALSGVTGLVFVDDGGTTEAPSDVREPVQPGPLGPQWAPVLVAWSDPTESPRLAGSVAGYAGPQSQDPDDRGLRIVTGQVVLDGPQLAGYRDPAEILATVEHELGHLAGLDHVSDVDDTMSARAEAGSPVQGYTPGALRGLRILGDGACFS